MIKSNNPKEKVVGILGGMGPYATLDFFKKILNLTPAKKDWEHLRIIIDNNVKIPSRTRAILYKEKNPVPDMIKSINNLAKLGADFVVVPCNSAHYFYKEVITNIKIPWLNMIETVSNNIKIQSPLILGGYTTVQKKLYSKYIKKAQYLDNQDNNLIFRVIEDIKLNSRPPDYLINEIILKYKSKIDSVLLACTELPLVFKTKLLNKIPIIDVNYEYAKATVRYAKGV